MNDTGSKTQFDVASLRRRLSDPAANEFPPGAAPDGPSLLNPLAQQIASQFRDENYSPALLIGQIRLLEFV